MEDLKYVWLNDNYFMGQLPTEWCSGAWWQFRVDGNAGGVGGGLSALQGVVVGGCSWWEGTP
jgi:hypothetical protein